MLWVSAFGLERSFLVDEKPKWKTELYQRFLLQFFVDCSHFFDSQQEQQTIGNGTMTFSCIAFTEMPSEASKMVLSWWHAFSNTSRTRSAFIKECTESLHAAKLESCSLWWRWQESVLARIYLYFCRASFFHSLLTPFGKTTTVNWLNWLIN